jgi:hypothetical protein
MDDNTTITGYADGVITMTTPSQINMSDLQAQLATAQLQLDSFTEYATQNTANLQSVVDSLTSTISTANALTT